MNILLLGGGGFAGEILCYIEDMVQAGTLDSNIPISVLDPHTPRTQDLLAINPDVNFVKSFHEAPPPDDTLAVVGLGDPIKRLEAFNDLKNRGYKLLSIVHPSAYIAKTAHIEDGAIIAPFAFVGPFARISKGTALNSHASAGHHSILGTCTVLGPYAAVNGAAETGEACMLGTASSMQPSSHLGAQSKLSAGSNFKGTCEPGSMAHGNPAKSRVMFKIA